MNKVVSHSPAETLRLSATLATLLTGGEVITLTGDLGAGKTTFTKGLARGLGVERQVNSPTFNIIKEYKGKELPLYHMDAYRIEDEYEELGLEEYFYDQGVSVIEWPDKIEAQLPAERLEITIRKSSDNEREISLTPKGKRYESLVGKLVNQ